MASRESKFLELAIPLVQSDEELHARAYQMYTHRLPAYIIGHALERPISPDDAIQIHQRNVGRVIAVTEGFHPDKQVSSLDIVFRHREPSQIGRFHSDLPYDMNGNTVYTKTEPIVHTTKTGAGDVTVAYLGNRPALTVTDNFGYDSVDSFINGHPHNMLLRGRVNPDLVQPVVFRGRLIPGYTFVHSAGNSEYATWHRMDTDPSEGQRTFLASRIIDDTGEYQRSQLNNYHGFDIEAVA